ncbi:nucleoside triphosphate pyrophosphohydrolase family protein [Sphingobacterium psychroaquaticum]|nr:hypothetical protein [Sphingobacterium psychroaquaticum]QBQ40314.1 hypothetical protein E2P86_03780 [Sphingobacterium psychroaquaticum]
MENKEIVIPGLNQLARRIFEDNQKKGFWDKELNIGEALMLITSELGEALEADRKGRHVKFEEFEQALERAGYCLEEFGVDHHYRLVSQIFLDLVKDTFEDEITDAMIRLFDLAGAMEIDIEQHIWTKLMYNRGRPRLHGKLY